MAEKYLQRHHVGLGHVGSYQVSARPFITSSIHVPYSGVVDTATNVAVVSFPYVTKFVTIRNDGPNEHGSSMRVAFSKEGLRDSNNNYFVLSGSESFSTDWKVTQVYLMGHDGNRADVDIVTTASVIAGLTGIEGSRLSGSWAGSVGV